MIEQMHGRLGHAPRGAGGADAPPLAGKRHQEIMTTPSATGPRESVGQNPASQIPAQLALHVARHRQCVRIPLASACQPGLQLLLHHSVQHLALGTAAAINPGCCNKCRAAGERDDSGHPCPKCPWIGRRTLRPKVHWPLLVNRASFARNGQRERSTIRA